jgi:hypothetical protein
MLLLSSCLYVSFGKLVCCCTPSRISRNRIVVIPQNQLQDTGTTMYEAEVELGDKTSLEAYVNGVSVFYGFGMEQVKFFKAEVWLPYEPYFAWL